MLAYYENTTIKGAVDSILLKPVNRQKACLVTTKPIGRLECI